MKRPLQEPTSGSGFLFGRILVKGVGNIPGSRFIEMEKGTGRNDFMRLYQQLLTQNACYQAGQTIIPKGIMLHSTGANNPNLRRYVGPDDGRLGVNANGNHWNTPYPDGRSVCVHGFIGLLADGTVATYQTLPWNHRGWHAGGDANNTHIGIEICEDSTDDPEYFRRVYREAVEACAWLCRQFGLTELDILSHDEGYQAGIASNHSDVMHWFPKHGASMKGFRQDVHTALSGGSWRAGSVAGFVDVSPEDWFAPAVEYVVKEGLMEGKGDGLFDPSSPVTRAELAAVLMRVHQT